jgi:hypothetical protein
MQIQDDFFYEKKPLAQINEGHKGCKNYTFKSFLFRNHFPAGHHPAFVADFPEQQCG